MIRLTTEQAAELTERINGRLREYGENVFEMTTPGVVRLAFDVIDEWQNDSSRPYLHAWVEGYDAGRTSARGEERLAAFAPNSTIGVAQPSAIPVTDDDVGGGEPDPWMTMAVMEGEDDRELDSIDSPHYEGDDWPDTSEDEDNADPPDYDPMLDFGSDDPNAPATPLSREVAAARGPFGDYPPGDDPRYQVVPVSQIAPKPIGPTRPVKLPDPDVAREQLATALATGTNGIGELTSLVSRKPRTLAEADAKSRRQLARETAQPKGKRGNVLPTIKEMIAEVQRIAMAGVMPTMAQFDASRPANWAACGAQLQRLQIRWEQLQERAGLKPNRKAGT